MLTLGLLPENILLSCTFHMLRSVNKQVSNKQSEYWEDASAHCDIIVPQFQERIGIVASREWKGRMAKYGSIAEKRAKIPPLG